MSGQDKSTLGIKSLPGSLTEALDALKSDCDYLKLCFYPELLETYMTLKREESFEVEGPKSTSTQPELLRSKLFMHYYDV